MMDDRSLLHSTLSWAARLCVTVTACVAFTQAPEVKAEAPDVVVVKAAMLHVGNGETIAGGMLVIRGDRIVQVGRDLTVPAGATVIELAVGAITPGLIDANAAIESRTIMAPASPSARQVLREMFESHRGHRHAGVGINCCGSTCPRSLQHATGKPCPMCGFPDAPPDLVVGTRPSSSRVETSSEVIPETRIIDSVDLRSEDFDRLVSGGVTTVFIAPDSAAVIGSQGAIVRTGGAAKDRVVRETDAIMASMGTDPSWRGGFNRPPFRRFVNFHVRRPTTRMGVAWVFRKAMYDTKRRDAGEEVYGADAPSDAAMAVLHRVLSHEVPLRIQARTQHDITSAMRLAKEFDLPFTLVEATEAHRCADELKAAGVPVVYGPIYVEAPGHRANSSEVDNARLHTLKALLDAGVTTALTAHELRDEDGLARQVMYAMRFGVSPEDALRCVTSAAAEVLGVAEDVGTLAPGKRADVVVWTGQPFVGTSRPAVVLIGGRVVLDRRDG